jgi:hypothetical protein
MELIHRVPVSIVIGSSMEETDMAGQRGDTS